jgi:cysteinyl-tRNA synthetase
MVETPHIHLHDTRTRAKVAFAPIDPARVRMYVCGPTVYDFAHIGNARPIIVFDVLFRLLRHVYGAGHVVYARNVTDVDDKINLRAHERGITIRELTDGTLRQFHADIGELGVLPPTIEPRATDHMAEMVAIIDRLIARGVAYVAEEHVLFHVPAMAALTKAPRYGVFARRSLDDMLAGARVDVAPYKRDPMDFVLWKPSREPHHPGWPSPGGITTPGRPGWHIECSAMAMKTLLEPFGGGLMADDPEKNTFDIHGGGIDLVFPHHENEIAQSCCAFGRAGEGQPVMANIWMHNGFLQVEGAKMSKSLGNFTTIRDLLNDWPGEVLRLTMLKTHYRQPIDWTERSMEESRATLDQWYALTDGVPAKAPSPAVLAALADDLATPKAIAELHALKSDPGTLRGSLELLGFLNGSAAGWAARRGAGASAIDEVRVGALILERLAARKAKDWAASDRLRAEIEALGVKLKDGKDPVTGEPVTTWERA